MVAMATATPTGSSFRLPRDGRPFTVHDLEAISDDGYRYELVDGTLIVSPTPSYEHQKVAFRLGVVLDAACPRGMEVLTAPFGVRPNETTELQPDVLVFREEDVTSRCLPVAPLLAVEVLSPSTKTLDLTLKKAAYQRLGAPSYWVIDPLELVLTVFELDGTGFNYQKVAEVSGDKVFEATQPFAVRIVPAELRRR